jgi:hypothetical protein
MPNPALALQLFSTAVAVKISCPQDKSAFCIKAKSLLDSALFFEHSQIFYLLSLLFLESSAVFVILIFNLYLGII